MIRDLIALSDSSKTWIYQADRFLTYDELDNMRPLIFEFLESWTAHRENLMTYGNIFHKRFLVIFVDESIHGASGCSIDASVKFITQLGSQFGIDFFDRATFTYMQEDEIYDIASNELVRAMESGKINEETLFFDNLVSTKGQFLKSWLKPLKSSWHYKFCI